MISIDIPAWVDQAVCASTDPALFDQGSYAHEARTICAQCPVIDLCREYAVQDPSLEGVWGGTTKRERAATRASRGIRRRTSECGTVAGYKRHLARKATPCTPCRNANAEYQRNRRAGLPQQPITREWTSTHGTEAGYKAHRRRGETACQQCTEAMRAASRARKARAS